MSGFQRAIAMMAIFWVVAPCSLVEIYQRFTSETSVNFCQGMAQ
jgi:hypothetical protein